MTQAKYWTDTSEITEWGGTTSTSAKSFPEPRVPTPRLWE